MTDRFRFETSWGSEAVAGGARFRLWAPSQERVSLHLPGTGSDLPMREAGDGWFALDTDAAQAGDAYCFRLADGMLVNDPAARAQMGDVNGPSRLVDPRAFAWRHADWRGRPLHEVVYYELHAGTFSPEGDFDGILRRLDHLAETGVTAVELLPVAQFGGNRGWGYDGVLLYAPHQAYGGPEGLKRLVDAAHGRGLMMILDVVYNHFGPEGNYLQLYAPDFFHPELNTPWGAAIAYEKQPVRQFFIDNALYWLEEYRFDGLRFDAIDQIDRHADESFLESAAAAIRQRIPDRHIHLSTEDERNITRLHERDADGRPRLFSAEWNDDVHHAAHVAATGETAGYYLDYAEDPAGKLARAVATGFVYQGEASPYHGGRARGAPSGHLPPTAFVNFIQNHDQIGNRAYGERLTTLARPEMVEALTALLLLSPQLPLLFMGEEWGETRPFKFFTDFHGELGTAVREGRRREFAHWPHFASSEHSALIADPNDEATFRESRLDWDKIGEPAHAARHALVRRLLDVRRREIMPLAAEIHGGAGRAESLGASAFAVHWRLAGGGALVLQANLGDAPLALPDAPTARPLFALRNGAADAMLAPLDVVASVEGGR